MLNTHVYEQAITRIYDELVAMKNDTSVTEDTRNAKIDTFMKYWNFIQKFGLTLNTYQDKNNTPHVRVYSNGCDPYVVNITFKHTAKQNKRYLTYNRDRFLERYLNKYEHKHGHLPKNMHYPVSPYYGGKSMAE